MLQLHVLGRLGADAVCRGDGGREFVSFRVAQAYRWTDADGVVHDSTQWVDCVINGRPSVLPYLKTGQLVYVQGSARLRVYDSAKDRCKKAGVQINVLNIELVGAAPDKVPTRLHDDDGRPYDVKKFYWCELTGGLLHDSKGNQFAVDDHGWILPRSEVTIPEDSVSNDTNK